MSNILTSAFPVKLIVASKAYRINWGHKDCLKIMIELEKNDLTAFEQCVYLVQALFVDIPEDMAEAIQQALWFMHGGREIEDAQAKADVVRTFSYEKDAELIYSAFSTRHGLDLADDEMHWWRFRALFTDLRETTFSELCNLRRRYKLGECNEHELELIADMGDEFMVEDAADLDWDKYQNLTAYEAAELARQNG